MEEQRHLLSNQNDAEESSGSEWSENSGDESYYTDSDSSVPEWESSVDENTGELWYIDCHPFVTQNVEANKPKEVVGGFTKNQLRQSTRSKFLRLIRSRESKRYNRRYPKVQENSDTVNKVKFQDFQEGEEKEVVLRILANNIRKSAHNIVVFSEALLGLNIGTLSDGQRVMIAGFLPESDAKYEKNIKIGDWLKSINNIEVTYQNINEILSQFADKTEVLLKLQRVAGVDVTKDPPINELNCQSKFVKQLINSDNDGRQLYREELCKIPIGILYLNTDKLSETNSDYEDVIYCYPRPYQKSILCNSRGIFITLNHLLDDITKTKPRSSSILHKDKMAHIIYFNNDKKLLLLMAPDHSLNCKELILIQQNLVRMLEFLYGSLDASFEKQPNFSHFDNFFDQFFGRLLNNKQWLNTYNPTELQNLFTKLPGQTEFESILPLASTLSLPSEAHMQIDDALTELEASDYREWNEEPLDCQRLFTILGSALYHYGYLLASHLIYEDLMDVHSYCRQQGLLYLSRTEPVKTLVIWKEVHPASCDRLRDNRIKIPEGKRYLLVVGSGKNLLAVLMEVGGCTEPPEENTGPDAFYVEEAQATLAHIQEMGIPELADRWLTMNPGPQVTVPEISCAKRKNDFLVGFGRSHNIQKKPEVTSILKRRNSDQTQTLSGSVFSLPDDGRDDHSEDSGSQGGQSERSALSDEIGGRRSGRRVKYDSDDEDSDLDDYGDGSQMSNNSFDMSELRQTLLSETEDIQPQQLTSGSTNVLFHFLQLDFTEGILLCPPECRMKSETLDLIINNFRKCCHQIHSLFQNTLRFKNMPIQDMGKSVMNKSLIAIKEHGTMFVCPFSDDLDNKKLKIRYWVVGRLFYTPHPREIYVCYQDNIPQNIIELAFKINLNTVY